MSSRSGSAPFRGLLRAKCSVEEATLRQQQRLLDPLEIRRGCDLRHPEAGAERSDADIVHYIITMVDNSPYG